MQALTLVDYAVLQSGGFVIQPNADRHFPIDFLPDDFVKGTGFAKPLLSYVCATHSESRLIIETPNSLIADLSITGDPLGWRSMHHTIDGDAFDFPQDPSIQFTVEGNSQVEFRDVILWYQRRAA